MTEICLPFSESVSLIRTRSRYLHGGVFIYYEPGDQYIRPFSTVRALVILVVMVVAVAAAAA